MIQIKVSTVIITVLVGFALCFGGGYFLGSSTVRSQSNALLGDMNSMLNNATAQINDLQYELNEAHSSLYEKNELIVTLRTAYAQNIGLRSDLRALDDTVDVLHSEIKILRDSLSIQPKTVIEREICPVDENPVVYLPYLINKSDDNVSLNGELDENGDFSMKLNVPLSLEVTVEKDKKTKQYNLIVTHNNPYVSIVDVCVKE